ncbi:hypothetical protein ACSTS3_09250 [Aquimarina muelleri]|uniref:hypothetical protein n=1 Tax=Aquimarina muelleri TaxID=279356 RepID=UPI003F6855E0
MKKDKLHKNNGGFKVPEEYFENLESRLSKKTPFKTEKKLLSKTKYSSGFKIPDEYFVGFENKILRKVKETKSKRKVISLITRKNILYFSSIAAMIAIIISLSISKESELSFNDITVADIYTYFNEENIELSTIEIATLLESDVSYTETLEKELINEDVILDYLSRGYLDDDIISVE